MRSGRRSRSWRDSSARGCDIHRSVKGIRVHVRRMLHRTRHYGLQGELGEEPRDEGADGEGLEGGGNADGAAEEPAQHEDAHLDAGSHGTHRTDAPRREPGHEPVAWTGS